MDKEEEEGRGGEKRQRRYNMTIVSTTPNRDCVKVYDVITHSDKQSVEETLTTYSETSSSGNFVMDQRDPYSRNL